MKEIIKKILTDTPPKWRTRIAKKNNYIEWIETEYPLVKLSIAIDCLVNESSPYCSVCNNPIKFLRKKTCSTACRTVLLKDKIPEIVDKRKQTCIDRYGVSNVGKLPIIHDKRIDTMVQKYGAKVSEYSLKKIKERVPELNKKAKTTILEKYGIQNVSQLSDHVEKCKNTYLKKHGVDNYFKSNEFIEKSVNDRFAKWNIIFPDSIELLNINSPEDKIELYKNPNLILEIKCRTCDTLSSIPSETAKWRIRNTGTPCYICGGISSGSLKQTDLRNFIESLGVKVVSNFILKNKKQIDIFCPDYNIGFEFDGLYWHNDLRLEKTYHYNKTISASEQNIKLIHVFEDEWDNRQEVVKSRIKNLLGVNQFKIHARKCKLITVSKNKEREFLEKFHIQGHARSSIAIGLEYEGNLVSLMTFSTLSRAKGHIAKINHWELLRFCSMLDTTVIGGAGKLLKSFINNYSPQEIISFADKRWSTGNLYQTLGFEKAKDTGLNYWYINLKERSRIHRYKLRKNKNDDINLTEYENRLAQGYLRIWDCGSSKWIWKRGE